MSDERLPSETNPVERATEMNQAERRAPSTNKGRTDMLGERGGKLSIMSDICCSTLDSFVANASLRAGSSPSPLFPKQTMVRNVYGFGLIIYGAGQIKCPSVDRHSMRATSEDLCLYAKGAMDTIGQPPAQSIPSLGSSSTWKAVAVAQASSFHRHQLSLRAICGE
jgi:hypothetical protein